jgi:hypothetical protein
VLFFFRMIYLSIHILSFFLCHVLSLLCFISTFLISKPSFLYLLFWLTCSSFSPFLLFYIISFPWAAI